MHSTCTLGKTFSTSSTSSLYPGGRPNQQPTRFSSLCRQTDRQPKGRDARAPALAGRARGGTGAGRVEIAMEGQCNQQDTVRTAGSETRESNERRRTSQRQMVRPTTNKKRENEAPFVSILGSGGGGGGGEEGRSSTLNPAKGLVRPKSS